MGNVGPYFSLLEWNYHPDNKLCKSDTDNIEHSSQKDTVFYLIDDSNNFFISVFPFMINVSRENTHEVSWWSDIRFVIKVIHKVWLGFELWVYHWISPFIDENHDKSCNDWCHKKQESNQKAEFLAFFVSEEYEWCY